MVSLKGENRMGLTKVVAWREKGRWHVVIDDPDVRGSASKGLHLRVNPRTKNNENLSAAYKRLTASE